MKTTKYLIIFYFATTSAFAGVGNLGLFYDYDVDQNNVRYAIIGADARTSNYNDVLGTITAPDGTVTKLLTKPDGGAVSLDGGGQGAFEVRKPGIFFTGKPKLPGKYGINVCQDGKCVAKVIIAYPVFSSSYIPSSYINQMDKSQGARAVFGVSVFFGYDIPGEVTVKIKIGKESLSFPGTVMMQQGGNPYSYSHQIEMLFAATDLEWLFGTIADADGSVSAMVTIVDRKKTVAKAKASMYRPY